MRNIDIFITGERNQNLNELFFRFLDESGFERNIKSEGHRTQGTSKYMHISYNISDDKELELMKAKMKEG